MSQTKEKTALERYRRLNRELKKSWDKRWKECKEKFLKTLGRPRGAVRPDGRST